MTESIEITRNPIRADDTASCKLVLNGIFILREHFEAQTVVHIQAASAGRAVQPGQENARTESVRERGGPVRRGGEPGLTWESPGWHRARRVGQVSGQHSPGRETENLAVCTPEQLSRISGFQVFTPPPAARKSGRVTPGRGGGGPGPVH
jgi:hypothetical protein